MRRVVLSLLTLGFAFGPALADPFASDWAKSTKSSARLVAGDPGIAGVEIHLSPGAITYWRDPGDSGAPPTFDFAASSNLRAAKVDFPAPRRIVESDGSLAYGYDSDVVFPVVLSPIDSNKPTIVNLSMTYAVCEKICLPARAQLSLAVTPGVSSSFQSEIAAARAREPKPLDASAVHVETASRADQKRLCVAKELGANPALFIEAPEGWRAVAMSDGAGSARGCFLVKVVEKPAGAAGPLRVRLTFVGESGAYETSLDLADPA